MPAGRIGADRLGAEVGERGAQALLGIGVGRGVELHQRELALDVRGLVEIGHLEHVDQACELCEHLAKVPLVAAQHDRHAGAAGLVRGAHGQRLDVEAACAQQPGDAAERPGPVDHERAHHVPALDGIGLAGGNGDGSRLDGHSPRALDHLGQALAGKHHRVDVLRLVEVEVDQRRPGHLACLGDDLVHLLGLRGAPGGDAVRGAQPHEVGPDELGGVVVLVVDDLLPLPDHPEPMVVEDRDAQRDLVLHQRGELLHRHLEAAVAGDGPRLALRGAERSAHGRGD